MNNFIAIFLLLLLIFLAFGGAVKIAKWTAWVPDQPISFIIFAVGESAWITFVLFLGSLLVEAYK